MVNLKKSKSKVISLILAVTLTFSILATNSNSLVFAQTDEHPGVFTVLVLNDGVPVSGTNVQAYNRGAVCSTTVETDSNGVAAMPVLTNTAFGTNNNFQFWIDGKTFLLDIEEGSTEHIVYDISRGSIVSNQIEGVTINAYNAKYDGSEHNAVLVSGTLSGDDIKYSTDGGNSYSSTVPTVEFPGDTFNVTVKIEREAYETYISSVYTSTVTNGEITGITVDAYNEAYDHNSHDTVTVNGTITGDTVEYSEDGETFTDVMPKIETPSSKSIVVKISRQYYDDYTATAVTATVINATIEGITVTPTVVTYDKSSHDAVSVNGTATGDIVEYSIDNKLYSEEVPQITNFGTLNVYVKVKRAYYNDYITFPVSFEAKINKAQITGVTANGYSAKYDKGSHDAVTAVNGTINGDTVTYCETEDGTYSATVPKVKNVNDSGKYYAKIHRDDNYEDLIIEVTVNITKKNDQTMSFGATPNVTYKEDNSFTYVIETKEEDAEGAITYAITDAGSTGATINTTSGKITYTGVGTITVIATRAACSNYEGTTKSYTIDIYYVSVPSYTVTPAVHSDASYDWHDGNVVIAATDWFVNKSSNALSLSTWDVNATETAEGTYSGYKVAFKNADGEITDLVAIDPFAIDLSNPKVNTFTLADKNTGTLPSILRILSFGLFFNESVEVTVNCSDIPDKSDALSSGMKSIVLYQYDVNGDKIKKVNADSVNLSSGTAKFTIDIGFEGILKAEVIDNVGRVSGEVLATTTNSNIGNDNVGGYIMLETDKPVISDIVDTALSGVVKETVNSKTIYSGDAQFEFKASDAGSGLYSVDVKINGTSYTGYPKSFETQNRVQQTYIINTAGLDAKNDGSYEVVVTATDNAGNVDEKSTTIYKDMTSATIKGFDFNLINSIDVSKGTDALYNAVEVTDYGFYFKEDVIVTITADDIKANKEIAAGVASITYKAIDLDGVVQYQNFDVLVNSNNQVSFTIDKDFKGQIYAYATDKMGNTPNNSNLPLEYDSNLIVKSGDNKGFVHPNGSVVESKTKHNETSSIEFTANEAIGAQNNKFNYEYVGDAESSDKVMDYDTEKNVPLYSNDTTFGVDVKDSYSGIRQVKWTLFENTDKTEGTITVDNSGSVTGDTDGWEVIKETGSNLVIEVKNIALRVSGNYNDMVLLVELTDRAGNTSYDYYAFGIDKTIPTIEVTYDNNTPDSDFTDFYKADRIATIVITERNFRAEDVIHSFTNTDGSIPALSEWKTTKGETPDQTTHTATIHYSADGDYTFDISYKDNALNKAKDVATHKFTLDKTLPYINVAYDNNSSQNGNYYKANRTATITITEHNFETSRVKVTGTANNGGTSVYFPATSTWNSVGDVHTATVHYSEDAQYTFDIDYTDKAGNIASDRSIETFYVDKQMPEISFGGVEDKSANNGDVAPIINFSDINFNKNNVTITLSGANRGNVNLDGSFNDIKNGQIYTFNNFEKIKEVDDLYTLTAKLVDMAGNETTKVINFSVNRFGSVYVFDDSLKSISGKYVKNEIDVIITEINVDSLKHDTINLKMTKSGTPTGLKENTDYKVEETGGDGQWSQYKYTVNKSLFVGDAKYTVTLYSEDNAKNINENIDESKEAEISFGIDKTAPVVVPIDFETGKQYAMDNKPVSISVKDNLVLNGVTIYLNDKEIEYIVDGENYSFNIPSASTKQTVKITAADAAGNETPVEIKNFLVSTNIFVRWYNNTPLFIGSIAGVSLSIIGFAVFLIFFRRKKEEV